METKQFRFKVNYFRKRFSIFKKELIFDICKCARRPKTKFQHHLKKVGWLHHCLHPKTRQNHLIKQSEHHFLTGAACETDYYCSLVKSISQHPTPPSSIVLLPLMNLSWHIKLIFCKTSSEYCWRYLHFVLKQL